MKRILLPAAALLTMALLLAGCTMDGDSITVTDPPRVTSNVTSSPAPATPEVTPDAPGAGSQPDRGNGLSSGSGLDQGSSPRGGLNGGTAGSGAGQTGTGEGALKGTESARTGK